ncbi:oxidoreductase [Streptomyces brasiliensis]|uniref:2-enoate reductase n=1 Tax=Streptomyces brasiliensis TaxID=1954 RepID=A0A917L105_9ACTN|nr:FAD-dependent oxidoreductase [Streptomyces brasiliensis]GGJ35258.1 2-enoate reductase [Streptomyces brasiliensis]
MGEVFAGDSRPEDVLFQPLQLGGVVLRNRVMLSAMTTGFGYEDGLPDGRLADHFSMIATDVGLATVAFGAVRPEGRVERKIPWMWASGVVERLARVTEVIHRHGALASLQLGHGGRQVSPKVTRTAPVGPSAIAPPVHVSDTPRELSTAEVEEIVEAFVDAAVRAAAAGFDVVELHGGHGYLIQQFLSAQSNQRTDRFGGAGLRERATFGRELITCVKERVPGLSLLVRINGDDLVPGGMRPDDAAAIGQIFAEAGADGLIVSGGVYGSVPWTIPVLDDPEPAFLHAAEVVKRAVAVPVVAVGGFRDPMTARAAISAGSCDAVGVGRQLLADPRWVAKARARQDAAIRPCVGTLQGCAGPLQIGGEISCTVNPDIGRPPGLRTTAATHRRRVAVVGGGPAGMEAARVAAEAGDHVTLWEARERLGGAAALAGMTPPMAHFGELAAWYERELARLRVDVVLGREVRPDATELADADLVLCAVGAETLIPPLDGYEKLQAWVVDDLLAGLPSTHGSSLRPSRPVVLGSGSEALSVALWLSDRGSSVTLLADTRVGDDMSGVARRALRARLDRAGVAVRPGRPVALTPDGVRADDGDVLPADAVVLAGRRGRVRWGGTGVSTIGDARDPRGLGQAIEEARMAVRSHTRRRA